MADHYNILAWRIPWGRSSGGYSPWGCKESDITEQLTPKHVLKKKKKAREKSSQGEIHWRIM